MIFRAVLFGIIGACIYADYTIEIAVAYVLLYGLAELLLFENLKTQNTALASYKAVSRLIVLMEISHIGKLAEEGLTIMEKQEMPDFELYPLSETEEKILSRARKGDENAMSAFLTDRQKTNSVDFEKVPHLTKMVMTQKLVKRIKEEQENESWK